MARCGVVRAGVFGWYVRGEETAASDIDFLVEFERGRSLVDLSGLRLDLCEALRGGVDVAAPASLQPKLRDRVHRELRWSGLNGLDRAVTRTGDRATVVAASAADG
jgi:uncharacterized protein